MLPPLLLLLAAANLQPYIAPNKFYALYKPADWRVAEEPRDDSFRVLVASPDAASSVDFFWARAEAKPDALRLLANYRRFLAQSCPDAAFSEVYLSRDSTKAVATIRCRARKGRYYFESTPGRDQVQGYIAPESALAAQRPLLLNIMASLAFSRNTAAATALRPTLVPRQAQDGSLSIRIPPDWVFLAAGGRIVTGAPDGAMGFIFTSFQGNPLVRNASVAQGIIPTPYQPPPQALGYILQAFGHRNINMLSSTPDSASLSECAGAGRRCDAQDVIARWTSKDGAECLGAVKMINFPPSPLGLWTTIMSGIWGPANDFPRHYQALAEIGSSFAINDQFARRYIQSGLENLRRLQQQTQAAMRDLNRAREENQAHWEAMQERKDYMNSKWDDYRRGNSYWVSDLEGGKVYHTDPGGTRDTGTGDYWEGRGYNWTNFEGQNPRYPSENMREVSSWEVEHGRRPPQ